MPRCNCQGARKFGISFFFGPRRDSCGPQSLGTAIYFHMLSVYFLTTYFFIFFLASFPLSLSPLEQYFVILLRIEKHTPAFYMIFVLSPKKLSTLPALDLVCVAVPPRSMATHAASRLATTFVWHGVSLFARPRLGVTPRGDHPVCQCPLGRRGSTHPLVWLINRQFQVSRGDQLLLFGFTMRRRRRFYF